MRAYSPDAYVTKSRINDSEGPEELVAESSQTAAPASLPSEQWTDFVKYLNKKNARLSGILRHAIPVNVSSKKWDICFKKGHYVKMLSSDSQKDLQTQASEYFKQSIEITLNQSAVQSSAATFAEAQKIYIAQENKLKKERAHQCSQVQSILSIFPNSVVRNIKLG